MKKYVKIPLIISATRIPKNKKDSPEWWEDLDPNVKKQVTPNINIDRSIDSVYDYNSLMIHTLEGPLHANAGDWLVEGIAGEVYPVKNEIFQKTYEPYREDYRDRPNISDEVRNLLKDTPSSDLSFPDFQLVERLKDAIDLHGRDKKLVDENQ